MYSFVDVRIDKTHSNLPVQDHSWLTATVCIWCHPLQPAFRLQHFYTELSKSSSGYSQRYKELEMDRKYSTVITKN